MSMQTADKWFSDFIRLRDCLLTTGNPDYGKCRTCGNIHHIKDLDCGHYVKRDIMGLRYCEENAHIQCHHCNRFRSGEQILHRQFIVNHYGEDVANFLDTELILEKRNPAKYRKKKYEFKLIASHYRQKYNKLLQGGLP